MGIVLYLCRMSVKRILGIAGAVAVAAVVGGCIYLNTLMPIITGYAAKNLASAIFISGRDQADVEALDLSFSFIERAGSGYPQLLPEARPHD